MIIVWNDILLLEWYSSFISQHSLSIQGIVLDLSKFKHPGGLTPLLKLAGQDATEAVSLIFLTLFRHLQNLTLINMFIYCFELYL